MSHSKTIEYLERKLKKHRKKKKKNKVARKKEILKYLDQASKEASCKKKYNKLLTKYESLKKENKELRVQIKQKGLGKNGSTKVAKQVQKSTHLDPEVPIQTAPKPREAEDSILDRIKKKVDSVNFERIGRANLMEKDDLKRIKGIGPMIEGRLNALGIYTYEQISKFSPKDEVIVNEAIEFFQGRISRDNWVEQATLFIQD